MSKIYIIISSTFSCNSDVKIILLKTGSDINPCTSGGTVTYDNGMKIKTERNDMVECKCDDENDFENDGIKVVNEKMKKT